MYTEHRMNMGRAYIAEHNESWAEREKDKRDDGKQGQTYFECLVKLCWCLDDSYLVGVDFELWSELVQVGCNRSQHGSVTWWC
jgi:hypothetical protein